MSFKRGRNNKTFEKRTEGFLVLVLTMSRHLTLVLQIALVGNKDDGEKVLVLDTQDLLVKSRNFLKRVAGGDRIYEQEALSCTHVLLTHRTKLLVYTRESVR